MGVLREEEELQDAVNELKIKLLSKIFIDHEQKEIEIEALESWKFGIEQVLNVEQAAAREKKEFLTEYGVRTTWSLLDDKESKDNRIYKLELLAIQDKNRQTVPQVRVAELESARNLHWQKFLENLNRIENRMPS